MPSNTNTRNKLNTPQEAGAYVRVSTKRQEDEKTEEVQIAEIKARVKLDGNHLSPSNIFVDTNWTGTILARPALDNMRKTAADGKFKVLYTYDRGRIARKYSYQEIVIEELEDKQIRFIPLRDKEVENEEDHFIQGMQGLFAEWERVKIADRFRIAKQRRAEAGRLINGHALYGYKIKRTQGKSNERKDEIREYIINEEEARVVRLIYKWFVYENVSLQQIIQRLYEMKIPPRKRKKDYWTKGPIERMLKCDTYTKGFIYFNKNEAIVPINPIQKTKYRRIKKSSRRARPRKEWIPYPVPIIIKDPSIFAKAQELLKTNKDHAKKNRKHPYLLTGLIWCGCGFKRTGDGRKIGNNYYRCAQRIYKHPRASECLIKGVNSMSMDEVVWNTISEMMADPNLLRAQAKINIQKLSSDNEVEESRSSLVKLIAKTEEELDRYAKAYGSGDIDINRHRNLTRDVKNKLKTYQTELDQLNQTPITGTNPEDLDVLCTTAQKIMNNMKYRDKRHLVRQLVHKVVIKEETVELKVHIPLQSDACTEKFVYEPESRNCWVAECWEINAI